MHQLHQSQFNRMEVGYVMQIEIHFLGNGRGANILSGLLQVCDKNLFTIYCHLITTSS